MRFRGSLTIITIIIIAGISLFLIMTQELEESIEREEISIAISVTPLASPFLIAQERGYFEQQGLDVTLVPATSGAVAMDRLVADEVHFATASEIPITYSSFENTNFMVLANFVRTSHDVSLLTLRSSGITLPNHFKGRRVGVTFGSSSHYFFYRYLLFGGVSIDDVQLVSLQPDEMKEALLSGAVDAVATWQPHAHDIQNSVPGSVDTFYYGSEVYTETFNLVGSRQYVLDNSQVAQRVITALDRAIGDIHNDFEDIVPIISNAVGSDQEYIENLLPNFTFRLSLEESLIQTFFDVARWAISSGQVTSTKVPEYNFFIYYSPLEQVRPEAVTIIR